jgi:hypothetical protein
VTGSGNGAQICASWSARADDLVEGDEEFNLMLALVNPATAFNLGNAATKIMIRDIDGAIILSYAVTIYSTQPFLHTAASFSIDRMGTVAEGGTEAMICVTMSAASINNVLGNDIVVALSTINGTGILYTCGLPSYCTFC